MPRIRNKPQHEVIAVPGAADRVVIDRVGLADGGGYVATAPDLPGVRGTGGHERRLPAMSRGPYGYGSRQHRPLGNRYRHRLRGRRGGRGQRGCRQDMGNSLVRSQGASRDRFVSPFFSSSAPTAAGGSTSTVGLASARFIQPILL